MNVLPDEGKAAADKQPVMEEKPPAGDPKPPEGDAKKNIVEPAPKVNAIDMDTLRIKAKTILEMSDDYAKRNEALALLMEIVTDGDATPAPSTQSKMPTKTVVEMDSKLIERLEALEAKFNSRTAEIDSLKAEKIAREAALKAEQDAKTSSALKANFDQAYQMEWETKYWPEIEKIRIDNFLANPEHAKHWVVKGDRRQIDPVGAAFVQHNNDSEEAEADSLGVPSVDDLSKKLGGKRA
jgi:hypothetical protein